MQKLTFTVLAVFAAVLVAFASTAAASGGSDDPPGDDHGGGKVTRTVAKSGNCSAASHSRLKVKAEDGRLETEFEVDQNVVGDTWRVRLTDNGTVVARGKKVTQAPSGSFTFRRRIANLAGTDTVSARAKNLTTGEVCTATASI